MTLATTLTDAVFTPTPEPPESTPTPTPAGALDTVLPAPPVTTNVDKTIASFNFIDQAADVITDGDIRAAQKDDEWCLELQRKKNPKNDPRRKKPAWFDARDGLLWRVDQDNQRRLGGARGAPPSAHRRRPHAAATRTSWP